MFFEVVFSLPLFLLFTFLNYSQRDTLTIAWVIYSAAVTATAGAIVAILAWFTILLPLRKRRNDG
jgi:hypothetical protein